MEVIVERANEKQFNEYRGRALHEFSKELEGIGWTTPRALNHGLNFLNPNTCYAVYHHIVGHIGFIDFQDLPDVIILQYLIIKPEYRRKGYGKATLEYMLKYSENRKLQSFYYRHNEASRALHEQVGFSPIGTVVQIS